MITLKPFKAYRPIKELAPKIASFPYDVINSEEARELAAGNPYSFLHVCKPEIDLPLDMDLYDDRVYEKGRDNLVNMMKQGWLIQDERPCLYIYSQRMGNRFQTGLVGCVSIDDYSEDRIKKHELTRKVKEDDRTRHVDAQNAHGEPVFLTYHNRGAIDSLIEAQMEKEPEYDFVSEDGIGHTLYAVTDQKVIERLIAEFERLAQLYVADGHHRSASAARVGFERRKQTPQYAGDEEFNFFMAVIFPDNQLEIMDYNRVVTDPNGLTEEELLEKLSETYIVEKCVSDEPYKPTRRGTVGMYLGGKWYKLTIRPEIVRKASVLDSLDVNILQKRVLEPILDISDPRTDRRIDFVGGIRGLDELVRLVDEDKFKLAFAMFPPSVADLTAIADAGGIMPPKSTWFEPKLRSGLFVHLLDDLE